MKKFEELTDEEKEKFIEKVAENDLESVSFDDLYRIAYRDRLNWLREHEEDLKEAYEFEEDME